MKKSLLALAVASVVAAPMVAIADGPTVYGSLRAQLVSAGGDLDIGDGVSRWGVKGSHDLGNGLSAIYKYEMKIAADTATGPEGGRLSYVGLSGGFGAVVLGQQWTPYYNSVAASSDVFAGNGLAYSPTTFRAGNALAYALPGGMPVSGAIALVIDGDSAEEDDVDAVNAGFSIGAGPVTIGLGIHSPAADGAEDITGVSIGGKFGGFGVTLLAEDNGDATPMALTATYGGFAVQFADDDGDNNAITVGYTHKLGDKTKIQFSAQDQDDKDDTKIVARLRVDF